MTLTRVPRVLHARGSSAWRKALLILTPDVFRLPFATGPLSKTTQSPTAWLNGLRGIVAIIVFNWHFLSVLTDRVQYPFASTPDHYSLFELPILRVLWNGMPGICFFFITGGFTVALRPLLLMREGWRKSESTRDPITRSPDLGPVLHSISSSAFRRWFRLYLPCMVVTGAATLIACTGLYKVNEPFVSQRNPWLKGKPEPSMPTMPTLSGQLHLWWSEMFDMMNVWDMSSRAPKVDNHLWTMRLEMRGSLCLYLLLMITSQCTERCRLLLMLVSTAWSIRMGRWVEPLFMFGASVAQTTLLYNPAMGTQTLNEPSRRESPKKAEGSPQESAMWDDASDMRLPADGSRTAAIQRISQLLIELIWHLSFFSGLFLLSIPFQEWKTAQGYSTALAISYSIAGSTTDRWLHDFTAALIFVLFCLKGPTSMYRRFFNHGALQYLGRISFAFYILHGPILHAGGYMIPIGLWMAMGYTGQPDSVLVWSITLLMGWVANLLLVVCAADVFEREVERRLIALTKNVEAMCFVK